MKEKLLSLPNLLRSYYSEMFFMLIDAVRLVAITCLLLGIRSRLSGLIFAVLTVFCKSYQYSLGSIEHDFIFHFFIIVLSFTNWGTSLALLPDKVKTWKIETLALPMIGLAVGWAMFTAGYQKALIWVDFDLGTSGFMRWFTEGYYALERNHFLAPYLMDTNWYIFEFFDYSAPLVELSALICLIWSRKMWFRWLLLIVIFHFMNIFLLNINSYVLPIVYASFIDWGFLYKRLESLFLHHKKILLTLVALMVVLRVVDVFFIHNFWNLFLHLVSDYYFLHLLFGIVTFAWLGWMMFRELRRMKTSGRSEVSTTE